MKTLTIENKEYTINYFVEAALYEKFIKETMGLMTDIGEAQKNKDFEKVCKSISNVPQTTLYMFHAGLLENHENISLKEAKALLFKFIRENNGTEFGNLYGVMEMLIEEMNKDEFFKLIGCEKIMESGKEKNTKKVSASNKNTTE